MPLVDPAVAIGTATALALCMDGAAATAAGAEAGGIAVMFGGGATAPAAPGAGPSPSSDMNFKYSSSMFAAGTVPPLPSPGTTILLIPRGFRLRLQEVDCEPGFSISPRGAGFIFGKDIVDEFNHRNTRFSKTL